MKDKVLDHSYHVVFFLILTDDVIPLYWGIPESDLYHEWWGSCAYHYPCAVDLDVLSVEVQSVNSDHLSKQNLPVSSRYKLSCTLQWHTYVAKYICS